ncbi:hypothetical protein R1flu_000383 [Riccia fluitans]|uniref:CCHC-type domain-containing protein n=1 Tax=Riccia fluitans TaxID=41844 RepID=A0ABD1Y0I0_9MARC
MKENELTKGRKELEQNVDEEVLFVGASNAFRNAQCSVFNAKQEKPRISEKGRKPLNDISNRLGTQQVKSASTSPLAKRSRPLNYDMEVLAQQIAMQVANSKAANANKVTSEHCSRMGPVEILSKRSEYTQGGNQEREQGQLPKVLYKASLSEPNKGKAPAIGTPNNLKPATYANKVAAGEQKAARPLEPQMRGVEAWKAARERKNITLKAAATSEDCIRRNRDRFQKLDNGRLEENPYPELEQQAAITEERREEIRETFQFLRQTQGKVVRAFIDAQQLSNRIQFLKEKTFVLYTVDISPSRDAILEWVEAVLHQEMGIKITRVRVLNKHYYLMTVENEHDRNRILDAAPLFLGPHMIFALPWDPKFDSAKLDNCKVPVWVELPNIHHCLEAFGTQLLQSIGEVLFTSCDDTDCRFTSIRGCLKLDLNLDLPEAIEIVDPDTGEMFKQPILYKSLPNACFHCHQRGHLVRECPICRQCRQVTTQKGDAGKMERVEQLIKNEKQTLETGIQPKRKPAEEVNKDNFVTSINPYDALAEEEPREDEEDEKELVPPRRNEDEPMS